MLECRCCGAPIFDDDVRGFCQQCVWNSITPHMGRKFLNDNKLLASFVCARLFEVEEPFVITPAFSAACEREFDRRIGDITLLAKLRHYIAFERFPCDSENWAEWCDRCVAGGFESVVMTYGRR